MCLKFCDLIMLNSGLSLRLLTASFILFSLIPRETHCQEQNKWDNLLFVGNKVSWGKNRWKTTGELQIRLKDNLESLDKWFVESIGSYLATKHWEFILPLRYSITSGPNEFRPGIGFLYKSYPNSKIQLSQQVLYQADISKIETQHGLRYVLFYNHKINDRLVPNAVAGAFYRWSNDYNGLQFIRAGGGLTYIIDKKHTLNFSYFLGITDSGEEWSFQGIPLIQLVINLGKDFQHIPAKFINF